MINVHNDSVVLPICKNIPFTYEGRLAFSLAATLGQNEKDSEIWEWLYLDFTQIICKKEIKGRIWHTFFHVYNPYNPFLKRKYALRMKKLWKDPEKALNDVVSHISKGYFVHIRLDLHYISALSCGESPLIHSEHIYGYDSKEQKLYLMRYDYNQGIYSVEISFDEFRKAYTPLIGDSQRLINVYDKVKMKTAFSFNSKRLCKRIINYSKDKFPLSDFFKTQLKVIPFAWDIPYGQSYGISAIKYVKKMMRIEYENDDWYSVYGGYLQSRTRLQAIYEFKKLMYERLIFMLDRNIIQSSEASKKLICEYKSVCDEYIVLRNIYLKYQLTGKKALLNDVIERIEPLIQKERKIINSLAEYFI